MSLEGLKFLQANLDYTRAASSSLTDYLQNHAIHLAVVGDPYVRSGMLPSLPHAFLQFSHPTDPKVLLLVQSVPFDPFPLLTSQYVVAVKFSSQSFSFLIIAVYAAPSVPISEILALCNQVLLANPNLPLIMAGDFNAKSPRWGGSVADARGNEVVQFLLSNDLNVLNDSNSPPTFVTDYSEAWIDLTILSSVWRGFATTWRVGKSPTLSDHKYIVFSIRSHQLPSCKHLTRAGQSRVVAALARERWFHTVTRCNL